MNPIFYPEVAKILSVKDNGICCPFCNSIIFLRNSHLYDKDYYEYYSICKCQARLNTHYSTDEGIYFVSYIINNDNNDFSYRIQYSFSQKKVWIKKSFNGSPKEENWEFAIDKINFLLENADQVETYLLFN